MSNFCRNVLNIYAVYNEINSFGACFRHVKDIMLARFMDQALNAISILRNGFSVLCRSQAVFFLKQLVKIRSVGVTDSGHDIGYALA